MTSSSKIDFRKLFSILGDKEKRVGLAKDNPDIVNEISKITAKMDDFLKNLTVEKAIKSIVWQDTLMQFGTYGSIKDTAKQVKKIDKETGKSYKVSYLKEHLSRGKVVSVDFGVSNIGTELSLLHLAVVISNYPNIAVVVPLTSQKDIKSISPDITKDFIPIYKKDYPFLDSDSYIMPHQIRAISKNRVTGIIDSISGTDVMYNLELKLYNSLTKFIKKKNEDEINRLNARIDELQIMIEDFLKENRQQVIDSNK